MQDETQTNDKPTPQVSPKATYYTPAFAKYHAKHPQVYWRLVNMARNVKSRGYKQYSIKTLWCVLRFIILMRPPDKPFKLPDQHHSRYARLIMDNEADLAGFFSLRTLRS